MLIFAGEQTQTERTTFDHFKQASPNTLTANRKRCITLALTADNVRQTT